MAAAADVPSAAAPSAGYPRGRHQGAFQLVTKSLGNGPYRRNPEESGHSELQVACCEGRVLLRILVWTVVAHVLPGADAAPPLCAACPLQPRSFFASDQRLRPPRQLREYHRRACSPPAGCHRRRPPPLQWLDWLPWHSIACPPGEAVAPAPCPTEVHGATEVWG